MDKLLQEAKRLIQQSPIESYLPIQGRIAYVISHDQSDTINEDTALTQSIAHALNAHGFDTLCFVAPDHLWSLNIDPRNIAPEIHVDGVRYIHARWDIAPQTEQERLEATTKKLEQIFLVYRPEIVLGNSDFMDGLPALMLARRFGLPFYWETRNLGGPSHATGEHSNKSVENEKKIFIAKQSDYIFSARPEITTELVKLGIDEKKILASNDVIFLKTDNLHFRKFIKSTAIAASDKLSIKKNQASALIQYSRQNDDHKTTPTTKDSNNSQHIDSFNKILEEAKSIPDSNGSEFFSKHHLRAGIIADVYMYNFYKDVFETTRYISPENYKEILQEDLDLIIYTTCWKGINNEEWRGVKFREAPQKALNEILDHAKKNQIKTVFQTIEDPSNFEYFLPIAKLFDYVLTTDTDCIDRYKQELGHERVFFGEYGVNPQFNNPIGSRRNIRNAVFFAGSYPKRYQDRCSDMEIIFDSIIDSGGELFIADRNFGTVSEDLAYPDRFCSSVLPPVQHDVLQKLHKLFRYNLNFNSIKNSPTMCAMRVYELQAQGNGLISNYANSVFNNFPGIRIIPFKQNMVFDFKYDESWEEYQQNVNNIREVLNSKTSYQVVSTLLKNIGLSNIEKTDTTIAVICKKKSNSIIHSFEAQTYPHKVLILESELQNWDRLRSEYGIGYFCWFNETNCYEKNYLNDLINAFKYTDSRYITKNAYFNESGQYIAGKQHEYTDFCSGKALSLFSNRYLNPGLFSQYNDMQGFRHPMGYSIDPFEVNFVRFMQHQISQPTKYQLSVIVPVYNNGRFLTTKCIPSLQRNELWKEMEILLIDDGSTDQDTINTLKHLDAIYPNIRVKFNNDGGSGSASRPRNQGMDMAVAPLITFLDPDNEIAPGAYDLLSALYYEANHLAKEPINFVSGFHVKVADEVKVIGRHTPKRSSVITDFKAGYFKRGKFPVIATQSAVLSNQFIRANNLRFVEGSAGQDTLFGWELIANAQKGAFTGDAYIIYYADRSDSITNDVDVRYFKKKLILEKFQVEFLKKNDLLNDYVTHHFDNFMKNWYLKKLELVKEIDREESISILNEISDMYGRKISDFT